MTHSLPTDVVDTGFGLTQTFDLSNREREREREGESESGWENERENFEREEERQLMNSCEEGINNYN